jgi:hypothetical protein
MVEDLNPSDWKSGQVYSGGGSENEGKAWTACMDGLDGICSLRKPFALPLVRGSMCLANG